MRSGAYRAQSNEGRGVVDRRDPGGNHTAFIDRTKNPSASGGAAVLGLEASAGGVLSSKLDVWWWMGCGPKGRSAFSQEATALPAAIVTALLLTSA